MPGAAAPGAAPPPPPPRTTATGRTVTPVPLVGLADDPLGRHGVPRLVHDRLQLWVHARLLPARGPARRPGSVPAARGPAPGFRAAPGRGGSGAPRRPRRRRAGARPPGPGVTPGRRALMVALVALVGTAALGAAAWGVRAPVTAGLVLLLALLLVALVVAAVEGGGRRRPRRAGSRGRDAGHRRL